MRHIDNSSFPTRFRCPRRVLRRIWRGLREWSGDSAYERYLQSSVTRASSSRTLTAAKFYVEQLNRRYSRPNRCC